MLEQPSDLLYICHPTGISRTSTELWIGKALVADFLKKHIGGKMVKITLPSGDLTGKILEFSPGGEFLILEGKSSFGPGASMEKILINVIRIETIKIIQDQEPP